MIPGNYKNVSRVIRSQENFKRLLGSFRDCRGYQEISGTFKREWRSHKISEAFKEVTGRSKGFQWVPGDHSGVSKGTPMVSECI